MCLAWGACTSDETLMTSGEEINAEFNISLPEGIATKAISDGLTAVYLTYAVYRVNDNEEQKLMSSVVQSNCLVKRQTTVNIPLTTGQDYKIVFWADAGPDSPYTIDLEASTMTMDYATESSLAANDENRDAFYAVVELTKVDGQTKSQSATLSRPFAQLNFGTDDLQRPIVASNAPVADITFSVKMPAGLATTLSLIDGTVSGATENVITFSAQGTPNDPFPVDGYSYAAMNYILCGANNAEEKEVLSDPVAFTASHAGLGDDVVCTVYNVPLQRNFRTNIYGSLITSPTAYEVEIEPYYDDKYHYILYKGEWYPLYDTEEEILAAIAAGGYVGLGCDVEVTGGLVLSKSASIDLNGYTLTVDTLSTTADLRIVNGSIETSTALTATDSTTLTLDSVSVVCETEEGYYTYAVYGDSCSKIVVTDSEVSMTCSYPSNQKARTYGVYGLGNVEVTNSAITVVSCGTGDYPLPPMGIYAYGGDSLVVRNCTINVSAVTGEKFINSPATAIYAGATVYSCIEDCNIYVVSNCYAYGVQVGNTGPTDIKNCYIDCFCDVTQAGVKAGITLNQSARCVTLHPSSSLSLNVTVDNCQLIGRQNSLYNGKPTAILMHANNSSSKCYVKNGTTTNITTEYSEGTAYDVWTNSSTSYVYYTSDVVFTDGTNTPVVGYDNSASNNVLSYTETEN